MPAVHYVAKAFDAHGLGIRENYDVRKKIPVVRRKYTSPTSLFHSPRPEGCLTECLPNSSQVRSLHRLDRISGDGERAKAKIGSGLGPFVSTSRLYTSFVLVQMQFMLLVVVLPTRSHASYVMLACIRICGYLLLSHRQRHQCPPGPCCREIWPNPTTSTAACIFAMATISDRSFSMPLHWSTP